MASCSPQRTFCPKSFIFSGKPEARLPFLGSFAVRAKSMPDGKKGSDLKAAVSAKQKKLGFTEVEEA